MAYIGVRTDSAARRANCPLPRRLPYLLLAAADELLVVSPFSREQALTAAEEAHLGAVLDHLAREHGQFRGAACWLDADDFRCTPLPGPPDESWILRLRFDRRCFAL